MKRRQKAGFLSLKSSKITVTKKKERTRRKSEEKGKKAMVALLVFIIATLEIGFGRKNWLDAKLVHLAITFSKIRVDVNKVKYRIFKIKIR